MLRSVLVWNNIKDEMIEYMQKLRNHRLHEERKTIIKTRRKTGVSVLRKYKLTHYDGDIMPTAPDFFDQEEVKSIIESPSDVPIDANSFKDVAGNLGSWIAEWRAGIKLSLAQRCAIDNLPVVHQPGDSDSRLQLALSVFKCTKDHCNQDDDLVEKCSEFQWFPQFLHHRCNRIGPIRYGEDNFNDSTLILGDGYKHVHRTLFSIEGLQFSAAASRVVRSIILACGWNPETMTVVQMDELDPRLFCLECKDRDRFESVKVFTWRRMVRKHQLMCAYPVFDRGLACRFTTAWTTTAEKSLCIKRSRTQGHGLSGCWNRSRSFNHARTQLPGDVSSVWMNLKSQIG